MAVPAWGRVYCYGTGDACGMGAIRIAVFTFFLAVFTGSGAFAAEITGKGFPLQAGSGAVAAAPAAPSASVVSPAPAAPQGDQPIRFPNPERARARTPREFTLPSIMPALLSVLGVCALFCAGLYIMKRYLPGHKQMFAHPAMEFLGRTHLDQKRFVSILRVGRRIVVVGVSADGMQTLSEITDEAEVTEILEVARPKTETGLTMFQKLFQRNVLDVEAASAKADAEIKAAQLDEQMSSIRERVNSIHNSGIHKGDRKPAVDVVPGRHLDAVG